MTLFPEPAAWHAACAADPTLAVWAGDWSFRFAIAIGPTTIGFDFVAGRVVAAGGAPQATLTATPEAWAKFLLPVPPRHHHNFFAMLARVPGTALDGDTLAFYQHAHVVRRVLELGRWLACGHAPPAPPSAHPPGSPSFAL